MNKPEFGNIEQIKIVEHESEMVAGLKNPVKCALCAGDGWIPHDCDCTFCDETVECGKCLGKGAHEK